MLNKILYVFIEILFPKSHLERYLSSCSSIEFQSKLTMRPQNKPRMFFPLYYKDPFVRDCIFELKERNSPDAARLFSSLLSKWILREIHLLQSTNNSSSTPIVFYLVPVPQHKSKTREKGFCHTTTLTNSIYAILKKHVPKEMISIHPCVFKNKNTKKLHDTLGKKKRFLIIKKSMRAVVTKKDAQDAYFFIIDDVYTTGATFKEMRRSLLDCGAFDEHVYFVSIAH